jgi:uncharacterized Zn-finger protein
MCQVATSSSGGNGELAFGDYWSVNGTVRANAHFLCADQAAANQDSVADNKVLCAFYAAANSCPRTYLQIAPDNNVAMNSFAGLDFEVAFMKETLGRR